MFDLYYCITNDHNIWLVGLAAVVCLIAANSAVLLLRQAVASKGRLRTNWTLTAGITTGLGIWTTHFVAMLGYDPGIVIGYDSVRTVLSLAIAIALTTVGFMAAVHRRGPAPYVVASVLIGGGIAAMHYIGMWAVEFPGSFAWRWDYVVFSVLFAIVPIHPALILALDRGGHGQGVAAAGLVTLAIVLLHFLGMTALSVIPIATDAMPSVLVSPGAMSVTLAGGAIALLLLACAAVFVTRRTQAAVHASEQKLGLLVKGITDCAIYMLDRDGRVTNWNSGAERLKGYAADQIIGAGLDRFYTEEDRAAGLAEAALAAARRDGIFTGEGWRVRSDGSRFWANVTIERLADARGRHIGFAKITRDMTRQKRDQDQLGAIRERLDLALSNMHQGLCLFDSEERLVLCNRRFREIWDLSESDCALGRSFRDISFAAMRARGTLPADESWFERTRETLTQSLADPESPPIVSEVGNKLVLSIASRALPDGGWVSTFDDITERRRSEEKIAFLAMHDALTGLPNRTRFLQWLDFEFECAGRTGQRLAVVMIDLDRFKEINDTHGHGAGDMLLGCLATRLTAVLNEGEVVARLGGDEFAAAKAFTTDAELADFVARIEACFSQPFADENASFLVEASLGIAAYPNDGADRETILNNADLAMYRAKGSVGVGTCYYQPGMDETARARRQLANDLRHAIERNEFKLVYQPQHSLRSGELSGYEALLRWHHSARGWIAPSDFIPVAEDTGDIFTIGRWVLRQACAEAVRWPEGTKIAVNLSPVQLMQPELPETIMEILIETGLPPSRLELEITETAIISDKVRALQVLRRIKALGISIAMDDFGTGYSSLDTLHAFPFDKIKIDKSFILHSDASPQARAIIRAVLALGHSLNVPVLAEGVESAAQLQMLESEGCDEVQGFYLGKPGDAPSQAEARAA